MSENYVWTVFEDGLSPEPIAQSRNTAMKGKNVSAAA